MSGIAGIGNTPLVRLDGLPGDDDAEVWVKLEAANPTGSYKDRMALAMIEDAERDGRLKPGQPVVEYSGGGTGSSLAFVCAVKGYPVGRAAAGAATDPGHGAPRVNVGTAGCFLGTTGRLRTALPTLRRVVVEPAESAVLSGGVPGTHHIEGGGIGSWLRCCGRKTSMTWSGFQRQRHSPWPGAPRKPTGSYLDPRQAPISLPPYRLPSASALAVALSPFRSIVA